MENQGLPKAMIMGIVGLIFIVLFGSSMFYTVDPGEKGILFKKFGGGLDKETVYGQGFHIIAPWNTLHIYDVKIHETFEKMEVLSKNGLSIKIDLSFRYMPIEEMIGYLHDEIGRNYLERIIKPEIRSVTREVIGNYLPEELYSTKREAIEDEIEVIGEAKTKNDINNEHTKSQLKDYIDYLKIFKNNGYLIFAVPYDNRAEMINLIRNFVREMDNELLINIFVIEDIFELATAV